MVSTMKKAAIAIDSWKLNIFTRELKADNYTTTDRTTLPGGTIIIKVPTDNMQRLAQTVLRANQMCAAQGPTQSATKEGEQ